jgi:hypothetical protein
MRMLQHPRHLQQHRQQAPPWRAAQAHGAATGGKFDREENVFAVALRLFHAQHARMVEALRHVRLVLQQRQRLIGGAAAQVQELQRNEASAGALVLRGPDLCVTAIAEPFLEDVSVGEPAPGFKARHGRPRPPRPGIRATARAIAGTAPRRCR